MIVDDDPFIRDVLQDICVECGWDAIGVATGPEAIAAVRMQRIEFAIVDFYLKDGDALPVLHGLRAIRPTMPVVVVTGRPGEDVTTASMAAGAVGVIAKPCTLAEIADVLERYQTIKIAGIKLFAVHGRRERARMDRLLLVEP